MTIDSKAAIPYGNNFDYTDPYPDATYGNYYYYFNPNNSGQQIFKDRAIGPVDSVNNPDGIGYMADLLQGSVDPSKLTQYGGTSISYNMVYPLIHGNTYTISCWIKPLFANLNTNFRLLGSGNWTTGLQSQTAMGNFSDPSWSYLNGSVSIIQSEVVGTYRSIGDLGIPDSLPGEYRLFSRPGDHIRSLSNNGSSSVLILDPGNDSSYALHDLSSSGLNTLLTKVKGATFIGQPIDPSSFLTTDNTSYVNVDAWARVAQETITSGVVSINTTKSGSIVSSGFSFTDILGRRITTVYQSYLTVDTSWRLQKLGFGIPQKRLNSNGTVWLDVNGLPMYYIGNISGNYYQIDTTQPYSFGFFFTGDLCIYGGLRIYDGSTLSSSFHSVPSGVWTRVSYTFVADLQMQDTFIFNNLVGFRPPYSTDQGYTKITLTTTQMGTPTIGANGLGYIKAIKLNDGRVFCVPYDAPVGVFYDPVLNTYTETGSIFPSSASYSDAVELDDGRIFLVPHNASHAVIYDPILDNLFTCAGSYNGYADYLGALKLPDGRILMIPSYDSKIGIYDPVANTLFRSIVVNNNSFGYWSGFLLDYNTVFFIM
jgi:hypothetical protein